MNHAQLTALGRALRLLGEHGESLGTDTPEAKLHEVKADLKRALDLLEETVTTAKPTTRCAEHPTGPVDEDAPDLCLLCETRRRIARRSKVNDSFTQGRPTAPDETLERTKSRYGVRGDRPQPQQRWLPEMWTGQVWQLCGTPAATNRKPSCSSPPSAAAPTRAWPTAWSTSSPTTRSYASGANPERSTSNPWATSSPPAPSQD